MARPTYYPDWAMNDTTLPSTGKANKVRPRDVIRTTGWDKGQIPTAEELNWLLDNTGKWIHYIIDEFMPTVPNTYLPKNGTSISFSGDLTGSVTWAGGNQGTGNIQVVDNSHNHISANITDATASNTANMIVKRTAEGAIEIGRYQCIYSNGSNADLWFRRSTDGNNAVGLNYAQGSNLFQIYFNSNSGTTPLSYIRMWSGYTEFTAPRSMSGQEGVGNALVRFDYFSGQINSTNNTINNVNNDLQNYKNAVNRTFVSAIRLSGRTSFVCSNGTYLFPAGCVETGLGDFGADNGYGTYSALQYYIPGQGWITAPGP